MPRLLRNPAQQVIVSSLLVQATVVVTGPLAVRLLGLDGRGEVAVVFATVILVGQVVPWGLPQAFAYSISRDEADSGVLVRAHAGRLLRLGLLAGVVAATATGGVTLLHATRAPFVQITVAFVGAMATTGVVLVVACLQGHGRFSTLALIQVVPGTVYMTGLIAFLVVGLDSVPAVLALYFSGWLAVAVIGIFLLVRRPDRRVEAEATPAFSRLRSYGRRVALAAAAPIDNLGIDQLAVGLLLGHQALGTFVVALAFRTPPALVLTSIAGLCMTQVARIEDPAEVRSYCRTWLSRATVLGVLAVLVIEVLVDLILVPAFGPAAASASTPAHLMVLTALPLGLRRVAAGMLQGLGHPGDATRAEAAGLVTMLIGFVPLGMTYGIVGAVGAVAAGALVTAGLCLRALHRRLHVPSTVG